MPTQTLERFFALFLCMSLAGCVGSTSDVRRLSPVWTAPAAPAVCKLIMIIQSSPAEKAGLVVGDDIESVNGKNPTDAANVSELVIQSPPEMTLTIRRSGVAQSVDVRLNDPSPRLGAVCDLSGWQRLGVTAAGNESLTAFNGAFELTASGIIDKGLVFLRARFSNNSNHPVTITRSAFTAKDGTNQPLLQMSPTQVMCFLYGEKGAHLLMLKRRRNESLGEVANSGATAEESCTGVPSNGLVPDADNEQFAEANAEYVAQESLWPATIAPGGAADGLLYFPEPASLPLTLTTTIENATFRIGLGVPQPRQAVSNEAELVRFFSAQKKSTPLRLTLKKGKVFVGKLESYDADNERVWVKDSSNILLKSVSFPITSIQSAESLGNTPAKSQPVSVTVN